MKQHHRLVPEEVEEEPRGENDEEDDDGHGMPQEAEEEDEEDDHDVVDAEVAEVAPHALLGLPEGVGAREGVEGEDFFPWAARGEGALGGGCGGA